MKVSDVSVHSKAAVDFFMNVSRLFLLLFSVCLNYAIADSDQIGNNSIAEPAATPIDKSPQYAEQFAEANRLLNESNLAEKNAREQILKANQTRKKVSELRAASRKASDEDEKNNLLEQADVKSKMLLEQQAQGAQHRLDALSLRAKSKTVMQQAFVGRWQQWVHSQTPLTMDKETINFIAHNAKVRSVHPTMLNKMGSAQENSLQSTEPFENSEAKAQSMTLQIPSLVSQNAPPDLNIDAFRYSNNQHYFAHIEVNGYIDSSKTNVSQIPLNKIHQWRLLLSDLNGSPVKDASIEVVGHMPGHVHGLPTQPQVTKELAPGVYLVEGLKFQMQGWWVMQFNVRPKGFINKSDENSDSQATDSIFFNLIL